MTFLRSPRLIALLPGFVLLVAASPAAAASTRVADDWWRPPRQATGSAAAAAGGALAARALPAAQSGCLDTPLVEMASSSVAGSARLCMTDQGVSAQLETSNLAAGNAYTVWFVYFDRPSTCQATPCAPADVMGDDPPGVLGRMDSLVADNTGKAAFSGSFRDLRLSSGSEVHLPIFGHGLARTDDNRAGARQLLTPEDPTLGVPGLGVPAAHPQAGPVAVALFELP